MTTTPKKPKTTDDNPPLTDRYGLVVPSALPLLDDREVLLLRLLGRLDMMTLKQIQQAVYPTYSGRGMQNRLDHLLENDLLWRVQTRTVAANHAAPRRSPGSSRTSGRRAGASRARRSAPTAAMACCGANT
jgi:hypothetical protein